jgi:hypothetical protein
MQLHHHNERVDWAAACDQTLKVISDLSRTVWGKERAAPHRLIEALMAHLVLALRGAGKEFSSWHTVFH